MKGLKSTAQTKYDLRYNFVFVSKYRKRVLTGEIKQRIGGMIKFACQINDWDIFELAIQPDHVHLYMGASPKWAPSDIMKIIKGGTSNKIRELFPELDEIYWGATFWADGYFVRSAGMVEDKVISEYARKQR